MQAFPEEVAAVSGEAAPAYSILKQRVDVDVDFVGRTLKGSTEITVQPLVKDVRHIRLHCRQCKPSAIQVGGIGAKWTYNDPYQKARMPEQSNMHQHEMLKAKLERSLKPAPQPELVINLPSKLKIQELTIDVDAEPVLPNGNPQEVKAESAPGVADNSTLATASQTPQFAPFKVFIEFEVDHFRDGAHWVGYADGEKRFPYMYTKVEPFAGNTSCLFPCVDDATSRYSWEFAISSYRTLGDAFRRRDSPPQQRPEPVATSIGDDVEMTGLSNADSDRNADKPHDASDYLVDFSEDEAAMDLAIVCVGDQIEDVVDAEDSSRHTITFSLTQPVAARHVGFAVGPFEQVDLSSFRGSEEEDRFGQTAIKVNGYCLPGRSADVRNTCAPMAWAIDSMGVKYGSYPFGTYQMLFIDDCIHDIAAAAGLTFCSSSLLFPDNVVEQLHSQPRVLVRALANQWSGVNVFSREPADAWVVSGMAGFMTDMYMKELAGNNDFRWCQKQAAEQVYDQDVDRPSLRQLGDLLHLDHTIQEFMDLKSALVLFILDRRMMKTSGMTGVQRIISKLFLNAKTGTLVNGEVSTLDFQRMCEKLGHSKLDPFFRQWVFHSGCPIFYVTQRYNKKKTSVEVTVVQKQLERVTKPAFEPSNFWREIKEYVGEVWAPEPIPVFTGPMTIRIHEADGTPYEHIVEIKDSIERFMLNYNTKYKRLKRSRRQKERQMAEGANAEGGEEALLYCLGDILDTEQERKDWNLVDWTEEDEEKMGQEFYEWIRMDADFEWIGKIHLVMPLYMYISQLQQDRDIVAQYESMRYLLGSNPHHVSLSILVRTLMDGRYFWGIREMAAQGLAICAKDQTRDLGIFHLTKAFRTMFCLGDTDMPKPNDFSDQRQLILQCAIPRAMAKLRDEDGKVPMQIRRFFVDVLKFNDNSNNTLYDGGPIISDNHYVATLMKCLTDSLIASHRVPQPTYIFSFGDDGDVPMEDDDGPDTEFEQLAVAQIERHRRMDEWHSSYQNIYTITALKCLQRLTRASIVKDKTPEVMKYVRSGNADNVRLAAFRSLSEMGVLRKMPAMRYLLHVLASDPSPRFRHNLLGVLGEALGHIALGEPASETTLTQPSASGELELEKEVSGETRKLEAARKTTPEGALLALKGALEKETPFKQGLWELATSQDVSLDEAAAACDIAALVFEPVESHVVSLKLPQKWACEHQGNGKMRFRSQGPYRITPQKPLSGTDYHKLHNLGLNYTGPLSKDANTIKGGFEGELKLKLKVSTEQLQQVQSGQPGPAAMPPPSSVTPSTEKAAGFKLNLGKRKASVDLTAASTAGSPKAQKVKRELTPGGTVQTPKGRGSPAVANQKRRSSTPKSGKAKKSKVVALKLGVSTTKAQEILSSVPQPRITPSKGRPPKQTSRSITPQLPHSSSFQSDFVYSPPSQPGMFPSPSFAGSPMQAPTMNLGGFRSYDPEPEPEVASPAESAEVKKEQHPEGGWTGDAMLEVQAGPSSGPSPAGMPPPARPKVKLKLGAPRRASGEGSPAG